MKEDDLEGTLVMEKLAEIDKVEDFLEAVDSDDIERVVRLMKLARIEATVIAAVVRKLGSAD